MTTMTTDLTDKQRDALRELGAFDFAHKNAVVVLSADMRGHVLDLEADQPNADSCGLICELDPAKARALAHYLTQWLEIVEGRPAPIYGWAAKEAGGKIQPQATDRSEAGAMNRWRSIAPAAPSDSFQIVRVRIEEVPED